MKSITNRALLSAVQNLVFLGVLLLPLGASARQEVLPPQDVFRYSVAAGTNSVTVSWDIEPGYYLYKSRMSYALDAGSIALGEPVYPQGEMHSDEFFGDQIIFRDKTVITIPFVAATSRAQKTELIIKSQGCADYGLCYPPQEWRAPINVLASAEASTLPAAFNTKSNRKLFGMGGNADEPLPINEAFVPSLIALDPFTLEIRWEIAAGYYLYKNSFAVSNPDAQVQLGKLDIPAGTLVDDLEYGETEVYYDSVTMRVPLSRSTRDAQTANILLEYQGCKEDSICYPPDSVLLAATLEEATVDTPSTVAAPVSEQDRLFGVVVDASLPTMMFIFLSLGLLLAFTPCCLPMVPILSGIIAGQGENVTTARSFWLSLSYVLGMAFTYTIAGAIFGAAGQQIQAALQTPAIIGTVAVLFIVLSLAMFGAYELQLPASWQTRLSTIGSGSKASSFAGTAVMGAISALVVSTCVAPPLVAALAVIAQTGDVVRGALALFALSMGMGIPLLIYGVSAGKLLPKAGPWMNAIKAVFGFMLLGLAIWMLDRVLPDMVTMLLWAALIIFAGIWMGAFSKLDAFVANRQTLSKAAGMMIVFYGAIVMVGAFSGSRNPLSPLDHVSGTKSAFAELPFERIKSVRDFEAARILAAAADKPLMLDFYADWCVSCKEMEHFTFTDPTVQEALQGTVLVQADVTANDELDQELLQHFGIFGPPTIVFFDRDGREIKNQRVIGYQDVDAFMTTLDYVLR
jgi:thiol:disulfide interchange protein DsbD